MVVAFPFVDVKIDTKGLQPVARRTAGVLAVVGVSDEGDAPPNVPVQVTTSSELAGSFGADSVLGRSLAVAMAQTPGPDKVYGVRVAAGDAQAGLGALESAKDVTFVAVAGSFATPGSPLGDLTALMTHCEVMSREGQKRIGIAALDPTIDAATDVDTLAASVEPLLSADGRLVIVAARGARDPAGNPVDIAAAAAGAIAGLPVSASIVLKPVRGFSIPVAQKYRPSEVVRLANKLIVPIIDPALIVGESLHFAEGTTFSSDATLRYVDTVRLLDEMDFALKAALIGLVGEARITRSGLRFIVQRAGGVLDRYVLAGAVDSWSIDVPVLAALELPEAQRSQVQIDGITAARNERFVEMTVTIVLGPIAHRISLTLKPTLA